MFTVYVSGLCFDSFAYLSSDYYDEAGQSEPAAYVCYKQSVPENCLSQQKPALKINK